jgi:conjugative transfer signal peptidase TraF
MPEARDLPLFCWDGELQRGRPERRQHIRLVCIGASAFLAGGLLGSVLWSPRPFLVWNATASSPIGLYRISHAREIAPGDMVLARPPQAVRRLAAERRYVPANVPLVKQVAAAHGDRVCALGEALSLNGRFLVLRRREDAAGRPLPWWTGCRELGPHQLFLLQKGAADSFDGRYFGVTEARDVMGEARLIWRP